MYPAVPLIVKTIVGVGVVLGGVAIMSKKDWRPKDLLSRLGSNRLNRNQSSNHRIESDSVKPLEPDENDALRKQLAEAEEQIVQLENQLKELRSENHKTKTDLEKNSQKMEEAKKLEVSFLELLQWLQKLLSKKTREETVSDITELISLLSANGLTIDRNYEPGREGFICVKDRFVTAPEVSLPVIAREDNIILEGIVKVPMSFAGAEPPAEQMNPVSHEDTQSGEDEGRAVVVEAEESALDNDDDFIVTSKKG